MSVHGAEVVWARGDADFLDNRYSRLHEWRFDGGAAVPASSSPAVVPAPFSAPEAVDPEEAFVAALASCHMLWFLSLAAKEGWRVDAYRDAAEGMLGRADGATRFVRMVLRPRVRFADGVGPDAARHAALHEAAHRHCYLANSVACPVDCEPAIEA